MDRVVALGLDLKLDAAPPSWPVRPDLAKAGARVRVGAGAIAASISWVSARSEHWPAYTRSGASPGWPAPELVPGVACLVFGIGVSGLEWVSRLARSGWFAGLEPRPEDMAVSKGEAVGRWCVPAGRTGTEQGIAGAAQAFFGHGTIPSAPLATVAVPPGASPADCAAALGLVAALREHRCGHGCRTAVVVTVEGDTLPALLVLVRALRDLGAFIVCAGLAASGDHLHHFPLRAVITPRGGRLVCVDLADHLACWPSGGVADLHVVPAAYDAAERVFRRLERAGRAGGRDARAINLHMHPDMAAPGSPLVKIDRLATACQALLLAPEGTMVFTSTERLDGTTATADLLVVRSSEGAGMAQDRLQPSPCRSAG